jgi:hypothetical protein
MENPGKKKEKTYDMMDGDEYRAFIKSVFAEDDDAVKALGTANTDWQDLIYRTAFSTDQNVSLYGSVKEKLPYRVSLGYTYDEATLKVGDNQRANMSISLTPKFFQDHLSVNLNAKGIYNRANYPNSGAIGDAISCDFYVSPNRNGGKLSMAQMMKEWVAHAKLGNKTKYYLNTDDYNGGSFQDILEKEPDEEEACESCKL